MSATGKAVVGNTRNKKDSRSSTRNVIKKRPHAEKLIRKLAKVFEEHMKEEEQKEGFCAGPRVKSWIETTHFTRKRAGNLIYDEDEHEETTFEKESLIKLEFKYRSYE